LRLTTRNERLEARVPKGKKRVILVWIAKDGKTTKVADTDPHRRDERYYDSYMAPYQPGGGQLSDAARTN
jgi:hypothetical protein